LKQSIIKLVDAIIKQIEEHPEVVQTENGLRSWLAREGYSKRDIDDALQLVRPKVSRTRVETRQMHTARALSEYEQFKLSSEARDALLRLESRGLLDLHEREMILDRLQQFEGEVGLEELDYLVSWLVCSTRDYETQRLVYDVFEGNRENIH
jgi:uncharacterized protein Smg (DUF494 family)